MVGAASQPDPLEELEDNLLGDLGKPGDLGLGYGKGVGHGDLHVDHGRVIVDQEASGECRVKVSTMHLTT